MRLPRRVPWSSLTELEQLCSWIYTDESDHQATLAAINRLAAWKAITPLPHALDSTLALLVVVHQDHLHNEGSSLALRQSYATAVIRLVNGLVDPLQLGAFARSIASIAKQLGLPPWLVELRHAATHEELPSLSLLREAARQSLSWLFHNYFLPTINPLASASSIPTPLRPLKPTLKQYKECMKIVSRDASLAVQYKTKITGLLRDVERWIAEAEVVANMSMDAVGWESHQNTDNATLGNDVREKWALERLCDDLLEKGGLVPLSKKKRMIAKGQSFPPKASIAIWAPLLQNVQELHPDFSLVLANRICARLLAAANPETSEDQIMFESRSDPSFDLCLSAWAVWLVEVCGIQSATEYDLRVEVASTLLRGLNSCFADPQSPKPSAFNLLQTLCNAKEELQEALDVLTQTAGKPPSRQWSPSDMTIMQERLGMLQKLVDSPSSEARDDDTEKASTEEIVAPGWRQLDYNHWRPCPIGVYVSL